MTAQVAAAYMGMPEDLFLAHFSKLGVKDGGLVFWAKFQLDQLIMSQYEYALAAPKGDALAQQYLKWASRRTRRPRDQLTEE